MSEVVKVKVKVWCCCFLKRGGATPEYLCKQTADGVPCRSRTEQSASSSMHLPFLYNDQCLHLHLNSSIVILNYRPGKYREGHFLRARKDTNIRCSSRSQPSDSVDSTVSLCRAFVPASCFSDSSFTTRYRLLVPAARFGTFTAIRTESLLGCHCKYTSIIDAWECRLYMSTDHFGSNPLSSG
jgi:hypothetical protein